MGNQTDPIVTVLEDADSPEEPLFDTRAFEAPIGPPLFAEDETGDSIEDPKRQKVEEPPDARDAKATIPTIGEWQDFWSRIVLRVACDYYIEMAFRGVDDSLLSDRDLDRLQMTDDERKRIAVPIAEFSHKSKFMRKHGRAIVASGGMVDAIVALGKWTSRVNRIARRYKPQTVKGRIYPDGSNRPDAETSDATGANGGRVGGWTIVNPGG
jgi:hypothetical protein